MAENPNKLTNEQLGDAQKQIEAILFLVEELDSRIEEGNNDAQYLLDELNEIKENTDRFIEMLEDIANA